MQRTVLTSLLLILFLAPAAAQDFKIQLLARPYGDSVLLRWAPADFATWSAMRRRGVTVERRGGPDRDWRPVTGERLLAYSVEDFEQLTDTENPHVVAAAEALHGAAEPPPGDQPEGPMARARNQLDEQEQRYFLAVVNADLSAEAANALGWRLMDRTAKAGVPYTYRIRLLPEEGQVGEPTVSNLVRLRANDLFPWGPVRRLEAVELDRKVVIRWPRVPSQQRYLAYYLEVSDDGRTFLPTTDVPLLKTDTGPDAHYFEHTVELIANYQPRHYRLKGINAFAEWSEPGDVVIAQGIDLSPPPEPGHVAARDNGKGGFDLRWKNPAWPGDISGLQIGRSRSYDGPFISLHDGLLPPTTTTFTDESPLPYQQHYYAVIAVDTAGNEATGRGGMAVWRDTDPPAQPTGLTGRVDTNGNVFLIWEPGAEPDLHGYRVFVSHARKNREYLQVTERILHENFYFDSTSLEVLNEDIFYRIVALDHNFNPSPYSETLTLRRPDTQPPSAPVISGYSARGDAVLLRWRPSETGDVTKQEVWRSDASTAWRPLRSLGAQDTSWTDTTVAVRTTYNYRIHSIDEAGLAGVSHELTVRSGAVTNRGGVTNLARTQVQGTDQEALRWTPPAGLLSGYRIYSGPTPEALRPARSLGPEATQFTLPAANHHYAIRVVYADGSRGPLSKVVHPTKR